MRNYSTPEMVLPLLLLLALLLTLPTLPEAHPELFVALHATSCTDHPSQAFAAHQAPIRDP